MRIHEPEFKVRLATAADLAEVLSWLKSEWDGSSGFWGNRKMIQDGQQAGNLIVVGNESIQVSGFLLATDSSMDIMEVRPELQGRGLGSKLALQGLHRIEQSGRIGLVIQCQPSTSIPFWKRFGFHEVERGWADPEDHLEFAFPKVFELPASRPVTEVRVELSRSNGDVLKRGIFISKAVSIDDGRLQLAERIAAYVEDGDTTVAISVGGELVSSKKAKYSGAVGVEYAYPFIRLDAVYP